MKNLSVSIAGLLPIAAMAAMLLLLPQFSGVSPEPLAAIGLEIDALPATGAGVGVSETADAKDLGGLTATGRVESVYLRVGRDVFMAVDHAPEHLRQSAERWVVIEFPELIADNVATARARLPSGESWVTAGDVVRIRFAHKENPRYFPVREVTQVTDLIARRDEALAKDYERRVLARTESAALRRASWLTPAPRAAGQFTVAEESR